jgi:hypothetical protein
MRWAELSHQMAHRDVPISVILETMLRGVTNERDVSNARLIYDRHPEDLICVWSGKVITGRTTLIMSFLIRCGTITVCGTSCRPIPG